MTPADDKMVELNVASPLPLVLGGFSLLLPADLSAESFAAVREQLEFRRKCMNQGFDNMLELLAIHERTILGAAGRREARP